MCRALNAAVPVHAVCLQPKWFHIPYLAFVGIFMRSGLHRAFDKYQPDAVVSTVLRVFDQHRPDAVW